MNRIGRNQYIEVFCRVESAALPLVSRGAFRILKKYWLLRSNCRSFLADRNGFIILLNWRWLQRCQKRRLYSTKATNHIIMPAFTIFLWLQRRSRTSQMCGHQLSFFRYTFLDPRSYHRWYSFVRTYLNGMVLKGYLRACDAI